MVNEDGFIVREIFSNDGLSMYVRDYPGPITGARSPILCIGGLTRNSKDFAGLAKYQSRYRRVICPDIRGRGRSEYDPNWENYEPPKYIEDMRHILCALGLHKVVVIGTSMGGVMAMAMAAAMPGFLKALVINDIGPVIRLDTLDEIIKYMKDPPRLKSWEEAGRHARAAFGSQIPLTTDADWARAARTCYIEQDDGTIIFDFDPNILKPILKENIQVHDLWQYFNATRNFPTLVFRGGKSVILDQPQLDEMHAHHPNLQSVVVPGVGHAPSMVEPEALGALNGFLEQH